MKLLILFLIFVIATQANDVIIIGGGLSGLTTAYRLLQAGLKVTIYEGDKEIGGRTRSIWYNETVGISVGGTWSMFENIETMELAKELGIMPEIGIGQYKELNIQRILKSPILLLKLWLIGSEISENYQSDQKELDYISVKSWLEQQEKVYGINAGKAVRDYLILLETMPRDLNISMLFASRLIYDRLRIVDDHSQFYSYGTYRWEGGTGVLVNMLGNKIKEMGGQIILNTKVTNIQWANDSIRVGEDKSKRVVMSISLPASKNIKYEPKIPIEYSHLFSGIHIFDDPVYQLILIYAEPWWEGGIILPDPETETDGVWGSMFELTPKDGAVGILRILIRSIHIKDLTLEQIVASGLKYLEKYYHNPKVSNALLSAQLYNWNDYNNTIPGVTYYYKPDGTLVKYGQYLRTTINGKLYWGGAERAKKGLHWIEGAISRGNEIALEILREENISFIANNDVGYIKKEYVYWTMKIIDIILSGLFKIAGLIFWMTSFA